MKLHELKPAANATQLSKRIGRGQGSGKGGTSTRGHKGAQSRSGYSHKIGFEGGQMPIYRLLPKRGFKNINRVEYSPINLRTLQLLADKTQQTEITLELLKANGLISLKDKIKILGNGEINSKLTVTAHAFSLSAKVAILNAGGKCINLTKGETVEELSEEDRQKAENRKQKTKPIEAEVQKAESRKQKAEPVVAESRKQKAEKQKVKPVAAEEQKAESRKQKAEPVVAEEQKAESRQQKAEPAVAEEQKAESRKQKAEPAVAEEQKAESRKQKAEPAVAEETPVVVEEVTVEEVAVEAIPVVTEPLVAEEIPAIIEEVTVEEIPVVTEAPLVAEEN